LNKSSHIVIHQKFSSTPGKPERDYGFLPSEMLKNKFHFYLNLYCNRLCGGFGEVGQIKKLTASLK
jgi:hypothetical protein